MVQNSNKFRKIPINVSIIFIVLLCLFYIVLTLPYELKIISNIGMEYYKFIHIQDININLIRITSLILLYISYRLYKRMKIAWIITVFFLIISSIINIIVTNSFFNPIVIFHIFSIIILILNYHEFNRKTDPNSLNLGVTLVYFSITLILFYIYIETIMLLKYDHMLIGNTLIKSTSIYENLINNEPIQTILYYAKFLIIISVLSITYSLFLILKPFIFQDSCHNNKIKVRNYLNTYGHNSISYLALENDKKYFFSKKVSGVIAYVLSSGVAVCAGDPICDENDVQPLILEFISFCKKNELKICFCQITDKYINELNKLGFGFTKYGEEALFDLDAYTISGKSKSKIRQAINKSNRLGIEVIEYKPLENRNYDIENQINEISKEWLSTKKIGELSFVLGSISLDMPMDRRYFIALDTDKKILGFIVFVPFLGGKGYYADVTRRKKDAPIGTMEKIVISAFDIMKMEGIKWGSLGVAPLANVTNNGVKKIHSILLDFIYKKINQFYGFKSLHQYKKKYGPTSWESRYLAYYPKIFCPKIAYSIIMVRKPKIIKSTINNLGQFYSNTLIKLYNF